MGGARAGDGVAGQRGRGRVGDHRRPRPPAGFCQAPQGSGIRARPPGAGDAGAGNGDETGGASLRRRGQGRAARGRCERRQGGRERGAGRTAGAAGPTAASPDSPPAAAPPDSSARPGRRRRGRTPGRGDCREPVPRATGPTPLSDGRGLERRSHKWRPASRAARKRRQRASGGRGRGLGLLPGISADAWQVRAAARGPGAGRLGESRLGLRVGREARRPGTSRPEWGSLPWPRPARGPRACSAVGPGSRQFGRASVFFPRRTTCRERSVSRSGPPNCNCHCKQ